jgi:GNAT superfamily N-acetyltransferase
MPTLEAPGKVPVIPGREATPILRAGTLRKPGNRRSLELVLQGLLQKVTKPFLKIFYVFEADLTGPLRSERQPDGLVVRLFQGSADSAEVCAALVSTGLSANDVTQRLQHGDLVSIAFVQGRVAAYTWMTFIDAWFQEIRMTLVVHDREAVQYDTLVLPAFRGQGLQFLLNAPVLEYAKQKGYVRTLAWVDALNIRSYKNQMKTGKRKIMTIVSVRFPGVQRVWNFSLGTPLRERLH